MTKRALRATTLFTVAGMTVAALAGLSGCGAKNDSIAAVQGSYVAALVDGAASGEPDALTLLALPIPTKSSSVDKWDTRYAQVPVDNAMLNRPGVIAATPDGKTLFVVSSSAVKVESPETPGDKVIAFDLTDPMKPGEGKPFLTSVKPMSVAVSPDGTRLAALTATADAELVFAPIADGGLGEAMGVEFAAVGLGKGKFARHIAWHPGGKHLAVVSAAERSVTFFEVVSDGPSNIGVARWGKSVSTGRSTPVMGCFSPDGSTFGLVTIAADSAAGTASPVPMTNVSLIRLAQPVSDDVKIEDLTHTNSPSRQIFGVPTGACFMSGSQPMFAVVTAQKNEAIGDLTLFANDGSGDLMAVAAIAIKGMPMGIGQAADGTLVVSRVSPTTDTESSEGQVRFYRYVPGRAQGDMGRIDAAELSVGVGNNPHGTVIVR